MTNDPVLDAELAAFCQSGVSITAGTRGAGLVPNATRALGCRVSADRRRVTVFILAAQSEGAMADIGANGAIAVVFSYPPTHRTVQLKAGDAVLGALEAGDAERIARYREAFRESLVGIGYGRGLPDTLLAGPLEDCVAVSFTPSAAFVQTPGPGAGKPLGGAR